MRVTLSQNFFQYCPFSIWLKQLLVSSLIRYAVLGGCKIWGQLEASSS